MKDFWAKKNNRPNTSGCLGRRGGPSRAVHGRIDQRTKRERKSISLGLRLDRQEGFMLACLPYETVTFLPYYVGREAGFFKDEGVDLDYLYTLSGGARGGKRKTIQLCADGDVAFFTSVSTAVEARLLGWADVKALAASNTRGSSMFARATIQRVGDLRGKRIMTGGGASRNEILYLAQVNGWEVGKDLELIPGDEVARSKAFADARIDAVCGRSLYKTYADQHGFHVFHLPGALWHDGGLCTSRDMIERKPEVVQAVVNGFVRAIVYIRQNKTEAVQMGARNIRWLDEVAVASHYDHMRFSADITHEGLSWMAGLLQVAKKSERKEGPSDMADLRFLTRAKERYQ
jgi:ABC-type nitrate/sulfonate/bicarbonate transport system substrate-binding protein